MGCLSDFFVWLLLELWLDLVCPLEMELTDDFGVTAERLKKGMF
jgi:hypothetical protein